MKLVLVLIALAACGSVTDPAVSEPASQGTPGGVVEVAAPARAAEAIAVIEQSYEASTGVQLEGVTVHWTAALIPCGDAMCGGLSYGCGSIWVYEQPGSAGVTMALAHELAHCARGVLTGDSDGDHSDAAWWSDYGYVHDATLAMRRAGY